MHKAIASAALQTLASTVVVALAAAGVAPVASADPPRLYTNERYVEEVRLAPALAILDPMAVFAFVFSSLPDRVKVYPTENYYYFSFVHDGTPFAGNIRLDPRDRNQGKVRFDFFQPPSEWKDEEGMQGYLLLDASHGVRVEPIERLVYRVTHGARSVVFALNDLSQVRPPASALSADERFLGPIFDESGVRFFFVHNAKLRIFHYILDETVRLPDELFRSARSDRILIGRRTGFAFFRDHRLERKILIGVHATSAHVNNYLDGPFDQLPENFIEGEALREAIVAADPGVKGKIDRLGHYLQGEQTQGNGRYLIQPYLLYRKEGDLYRFHACASSRAKASAAYYRCFVTDVQGEPAGAPSRPRK